MRINCAYPEADLDAAVRPGVSRISHPKTDHAEQIRKVDAIITRLERERGIRPGTIEINAMIETTLGVANSYDIAASSPRVKSFSPGTGYDMSMDMGLEMFVGFDQFFYNRGEGELIAMALGQNRAGGVYMTDTSGSVTDGDRTLEQAIANRKAGFQVGRRPASQRGAATERRAHTSAGGGGTRPTRARPVRGDRRARRG